MKVCPVCKFKNKPEELKCPVCGTYLPSEEEWLKQAQSTPTEEPIAESFANPAPTPAPASPSPEEVRAAEERWEKGKYNRMAIAGFVLSLMGVATFVTSPLQLTALILCLASGKADRFLKLRRVGLILSAVFLVVSIVFWVVTAWNFESILQWISSVNDYLNEFTY